ncbi:MAG: sulfur oxidoreductase [Chloroflexota bacterium]|nr:MAG: sulfur oxidoreductase [Chloroflexota bacterium]
MPQKHVVFTFNRAPYGSIFYNEGLRAVVGVTSGVDEHTMDVVYLGDGVYFTNKDVDRADSGRYLGTLAKAGVKLKAEQEALEERGLTASDLAEDVEIVPRREVLTLINKADVTIDF